MPIDQILEDVQKLTPEDKQRLLEALAKDQTAKLTPEQKLAINDHVAQIVSKWADWLGKVAAAIGILSILALASSLGYVFFILPDKAVTIAQGSIERRLGERTKTIEERITKILQDYGSEQESYKNLSKKSDAISQDLEKRASELDDKFATLEQGPASKAADVVKAVQTNATGSDLVLDVATLKTDVAALHQVLKKPSLIAQGQSPDGQFQDYVNDFVISQSGLLIASATLLAPFNGKTQATAALDISIDHIPVASNSAISLAAPNAPYTLTVNASGVRVLTKGSHHIEIKVNTVWDKPSSAPGFRGEYYVIGVSG